MRRIALIQGHPDPDPARLCRALADSYAAGATEAGHAVTRIGLASLEVPILRTRDEFETGGVPGSLAAAQSAIVAADHLVLVFPLWLGTMPALVKAFLEQVFRPGVAFRYRADGFPQRLLDGRSARIVVTMGMPVLAYRWWFRAHGLRGLERSVLRLAGIRPIRESLYGRVEVVGDATRAAWLAELCHLGSLGE